MPRYPSLWLACLRADRQVRRHGLPSIEDRREAERRQADQPTDRADGLQVADHKVPVEGGTITVRSYRQPATQPAPAHLLAHGGAFCTGGPGQVDALARRYAATVGCAVFSIDYRLAPEHTFPTAAEDYYAVLAWVSAQASRLGVDASRISVGGVSVGAGLAAAAALMARDRAGPSIAFQLLEIPQLDLTLSQPSMARYADGYLVTRAELLRGVTNYCPDPAQRRHPYASPLLAPDLRGLPPAAVLVNQYDPLRDDGERYAARLRAAGVAAELIHAKGHVHSSTYSPMRSARRYVDRTSDALRGAARRHHPAR